MKKIITGLCLTLALGFSFLNDVTENEAAATSQVQTAWVPGGDGGGGGD
jgi:hypothetical protein